MRRVGAAALLLGGLVLGAFACDRAKPRERADKQGDVQEPTPVEAPNRAAEPEPAAEEVSEPQPVAAPRRAPPAAKPTPAPPPPPPAAPPPPKAAPKPNNCGCKPNDLMCAMKCNSKK